MTYVSLEAESATIGAMVLSERAADIAVQMLHHEDFVGESHQVIFMALDQVRKKGDPIDELVVKRMLGMLNLSEKASERFWDRIIDCAEQCAAPSNIQHYCNIVKGLSWKRARKTELDRLVADFEDGDPDVLMSAVKQFGESWYGGSGGSLTRWADIDVEEAERGIPTGYGESVDALTRVGWVAGQLNVVSAYHKGGKTTFMTGSMAANVKAGRRIVYATFADLSPSQLKRRIIKQECGIGSFPKTRMDLAGEYIDTLEAMNDQAGAWRNALVYNARQHGRDVETFYGRMLVEHSRKPIEAIFCDYAQKITSREVAVKGGKTAQLEHVSDQLDELAGKLGVPVIVGSQVTKGEGGEWVTKYARALEEDAGFVLRVIREDEEKAKVICAYNRFGPQDVEIPMKWNDKRVRFEPYPVTHVAVNQ